MRAHIMGAHRKIETLKQQVTAALGLAPAEASLALREPAPYQSNHLYDLRAGRGHWIVKEYRKPDEFDLAPRREYGALERLESLDIAPRPVLLQVEPRPPLGPFVVYEYMPGRMWDRRRPSAAELGRLAQIWLAFAELPVDDLPLARAYEGSPVQAAAGWRRAFENYAEWAEAQFPAAFPAARLCQEALARHGADIQELAKSRPRLTFGRSDSRFANIIARPGGRIGIVDWEDSGLIDPALDLADLMVHANQEDLLSVGEWEAFLALYLATRGTADPGLEWRLALYQVLLSFLWLSILLSRGVVLSQNGRLNEWLINEIPANQRLRRYLARVLVRPGGHLTGQLEGLSGLTFFPVVESDV
jgi:aminoglycoside phosphotransferase (APT) family kinase protein